MRLLLLASLIATPAAAWEFSPTPVCTLEHEATDSAWTLTYDPAEDLYAIALTRAVTDWPAATVFAIAFEGPRGLTISTTRHALSGDGRTLTVTDTGFGNVLDGLQYNATATAMIGDARVIADLEGAAPEVEAFRACTVGGVV